MTAPKFIHAAHRTLAAKYPRAYQFFLDRFSLDKFTGLPFTILLICFGANLLVLNEIVESLVDSPLMISLDKSFAQFLYSIRIHAIAVALFYFTKLCSFWVVIIAALLTTSIFWAKGKFIYILPLWIALAGTGITIYSGKDYFHRIRPADINYYVETLYSFPSGHSTTAVAFYGVIFYSIIRNTKRHRVKFRWMIGALLFMLLLGFSRLYLGVHYLSDVLGGYSLGLLWLLLAISITEWRMHKRKYRHKP